MLLTVQLLEREAELTALRSLLEAARDGYGGTALVEAPAGQGKTTLLRALRAGAGGMRVLSATGAELERDFAFGIVRQLFEDELFGSDDARRARLLAGSAQFATHVVEGGGYEPALSNDACHVRLHGLARMAANLAEEKPLVLLVDDAHWADPGSLQALGMLARRIDELPIALIVAARPAELEQLEPLAKATVLHPQALSAKAVEALLDDLGELDPAFVSAVVDTTAGNPLLVRELQRTLLEAGFAGRADEAEGVRRTVPGTITRMVRTRLAAVSPEARALARAAAVIGSRAAVLAGIDAPAATRAHAELADANLLERHGLTFTHPMMREATLAGVVAGERSELHRRAAELLLGAGADEREVAAHYMAAAPAGDPLAAQVLTAAGEHASAAGDTGVAIELLRRASEELPPSPELLLALGLAEGRLGLPEAHEHLAAAMAGDDAVAARAAQARGRLLVLSGRARHAVEVLREGIERARTTTPATSRSPLAAAFGVAAPALLGAASPEGVATDLAAELEDDLLDALIYDPDLAAEREALLQRAEPRPAVLAFRAFDAAATGAPADTVRELARQALAGGALLRGNGIERPAVQYAIEALMAVEAADEARAGLDELAAVARRAGSRVGAGVVALLRARWEHEFGDLEAAADAARSALEIQASLLRHGPSTPVRVALAAALFDAGDIDGAERALAGAHMPERGIPICGFHTLRARILLARGRAAEALEDVRTQIALEQRRGWVQTFREYMRATLVTALAEAGHIEEALQTADQALETARERGLAASESRLLIARARLAIAREDELAYLEAAVAAARRSRSALNQAEAFERSAPRCAAPAAGPMRASRCGKRANWPSAPAPRASNSASTRSWSSPARVRSASPRRASTGSRPPSDASPSWPRPAVAIVRSPTSCS